MRAIVLQHEQHEGLGLLEPALREVGFEPLVRFRDVEHGDVGAPLVVVLGGNMNVGDPSHPFLAKEQAFLSERLANGGPCLGICLGAQLMAAALGSEVFEGKNGLEKGVGPVRLTKPGSDDPVFSGLPQKLVVAHWHAWTFSAVEGATLLGSSDRYTQQIFRRGASYGFQPHIEVDAATFEKWAETEGERSRISERLKAGREGAASPTRNAGASKLRACEPHLKRLATQLAHHFARAASTAFVT